MELENLEAAIEAIAKHEKKYHSNAYRFVIMAVGSLVRMKIKQDGQGPVRIDYNEQMQWIKLYGWYTFGMLSKLVFNKWGLKTSNDLLEVLKQLIRYNLINKQSFKNRSSPVVGFDFSDYDNEDMFETYPI